MTVTVELVSGASLTFAMPTATDMRAAYKLKPKIEEFTSQKLDDTAAVELYAEIHAVLAPLLKGCSDASESVEELRESVLLFGPTGVALWMELFFRSFGAPVRKAG